MYAVEFEATVKDGLIEIPDEFRESLSEQVRVILLVKRSRRQKRNMIKHLLEHPLHLVDPRPLSRADLHER